MQHITRLTAVVAIIALLSACGASGKEEKGDLKDNKAQLQKLKKEQAALETKIKALEDTIAKTDPLAVAVPKLVGVTTLATQNFEHYIDLQGHIDAENISYISPKSSGGAPGGFVKALYIKKGDFVKKGQLVLKLDDGVMLQTLEQQKTQLAYAKDIFTRRKNLWDQGIGSEVEYISARNNVDNIERQIATTREMWNATNVYSDVTGIADEVNIKVGEFFQGVSAAGPQIKIVNNNELKAVVSVPENYLPKVKRGTAVLVDVPDANKQFNSTVSLISQVINNNSRSFTAEAKIPRNTAGLKPNQLATVRLQDYTASNVIVVPLTSVQTDDKGKYVYLMVQENGRSISRKKQVVVGEVYGDRIEVKQGLNVGDKLVTQGFESIYDGQVITTETK